MNDAKELTEALGSGTGNAILNGMMQHLRVTIDGEELDTRDPAELARLALMMVLASASAPGHVRYNPANGMVMMQLVLPGSGHRAHVVVDAREPVAAAQNDLF